MKLVYMLSIDDWVAFSLHYLETSPEGRRARSNGQITGSLIFFMIGCILAVSKNSFSPLLLSSLAGVVWYFVWPELLRSSQRVATEQRHRESQNPCLNGIHLLELTRGGLHASCDVSDTVIQWAGIERIENNSTHGFVYLRNSTGYVIPREKVREGDFSSFITQMKQHLQEISSNPKTKV